MPRDQPTLFDRPGGPVSHKEMLLFALGDFQSRGKTLADREIALDRLLGAFRRAANYFESELPPDSEIVRQLEILGAKIHQVQSFVAKHPFRIVVPKALAAEASESYSAILNRTANDLGGKKLTGSLGNRFQIESKV